MDEIKQAPWQWEVNDQRASGWMNNAMYVGCAHTGRILLRVYNDHADEEEVAKLCAAAPDMLTALETVLAGGHLNTGEQAIVANAIAKATGRNVADVVKGA